MIDRIRDHFRHGDFDWPSLVPPIVLAWIVLCCLWAFKRQEDTKQQCVESGGFYVYRSGVCVDRDALIDLE